MQFKYFDPRENLGYQMGMALRDIRTAMDKRQAQFDFSRNEWLIIGILLKSDNGYLRQCDIRQYIGIEDSYLTKVLDKLIDKKIIRKMICENDRRVRTLTIDPTAKKLIKKVVNEIVDANEAYLEGFSKKERA